MLPVTIAAVAAGLFWLGLFLRHRKQPAGPRTLLVILVAVGLLCRLGFVFFTPVFYAPDEESHYNYVRFLVENKALPVQTSKLGEYTNDFEYNQPPLYYFVLTPIFWLGRAGFDGVRATVILLRLISVLLWGVNVWLGRVWLKRLEVKDPAIWVFVMGMICLLPTYIFVSAVINNDNLLATLGGGLLCLLAKREQALRTPLATGLLLGLALLAKQSAVVFIPAIVALAVLDGIQQRVKWGVVLRQLATVMGVAALIYSPRALWSLQVYGTLTPEFLILTPIPWPSFVHGLASASHNLVKTFWAVSGITNNVAYPFPLVGMLLMGLWVLGQQRGRGGARGGSDTKPGPGGAMMWALLIAVVVNVALVLRFGYLSGMGQGRHLFPVLFPIALVLALGLRRLPIKNPAIQAAGFWVSYAVIFTAFSLNRFP